MGSIIKEDTKGEPSAALTETGKGGLFAEGYLRDTPACEYVGDGETAVFVLTDGETGIGRERDGERARIPPGDGYRAITVVTDRRINVLIGHDGGDKRITLPLVEVDAARTDAGALVLEMSSGVTWRCRGERKGIDEVAAYVDATASAWRDVESTLDSVKRSIVAATGHRDAGEYDEALAGVRAARDHVESATERARTFTGEWPCEAMIRRVETVHNRCLETAAEVRMGVARARMDEAEEYWRNGEYERARDAFEETRAAYEAVRTIDARHRRDVEDVDAALERVERTIDRFDDAPLRNAINADRRAAEADSDRETLDALDEARAYYSIVLDVDSGDGKRRFAGDRDRIRERREAVVDRFVDAALAVASADVETAEWYRDTARPGLAADELEGAIEVLDRGLEVATTDRPGEADALRRKRSSAREQLEDLADVDDEADHPASVIDEAYDTAIADVGTPTDEASPSE